MSLVLYDEWEGFDVPGRDDVDTDALIWHRAPQAVHQPSEAPFAGAVLRRPGHVEVRGQRGGHDQRGIPGRGAREVVRGEFGCVVHGDEVDLEDREVGFLRVVARGGGGGGLPD